MSIKKSVQGVAVMIARNGKRVGLMGGLALLLACGAGEPAGPEARKLAAAIAWVIDYDNAGDASDVRLGLVPADDEADVAEYRIFLVKESAASAFDVAAAQALGQARYHAVAPASDSVVRLPAGLADADGDAVVEGVAYRAMVLTLPAGGSEAVSGLERAPRVLELATTHLVRTLTGRIQAGSGGLDVDADGNIYHADFGATLSGPPGEAVYKVTPDGDVSIFATGLVGASGNHFGSNGDLFQSNIAANRISRITPDGTVSTFASEGLSSPVGIAMDADDNLYVANCNDNTIRKITADGTSVPFSASPLYSCPNGITLASDGNLYVANFGNGDVLKVSPTGQASPFVTLPGGNNGHILFGNGVLYIVDRGGHQLVEATLEGETRVIAGSGQRGELDGAALQARLSLTNDVALSPDGSILYFNDVAQAIGPVSDISPTTVRALTFVEGAIQ